MLAALKEAVKGEKEQEVPVGAVVVFRDRIVARAHNQTIKRQDPTAHAEILAMRHAARKLGNYRLSGASMYVTVKPCPMCCGAMIWARIKRVVYGAPCGRNEPNHRLLKRGGVLAAESRDIMKGFFRERR